MAVSQNGYEACNKALLHNPTVPGTNIDFPGGLRKGPAGDILLWVAIQLHTRVESGETGYGMWGYACRDIRGLFTDEDEIFLRANGITIAPEPGLGNAPCSYLNPDFLEDARLAGTYSNHASGTAIDWHAPRHPLGKRNTYSIEKIAIIHQIEAETEHCVRWGGDWDRPDDMHWETVKSEAECRRVLTKLGWYGTVKPKLLMIGEDDVSEWYMPHAYVQDAAGVWHKQLEFNEKGQVKPGQALEICPVDVVSMVNKRAWLSICCPFTDGMMPALWMMAGQADILEAANAVRFWDGPGTNGRYVIENISLPANMRRYVELPSGFDKIAFLYLTADVHNPIKTRWEILTK